jgi:hypothetical protein
MRLAVSILAARIIAGCAGPTAHSSVAVPPAPVGDLAGTWRRAYRWLGGVSYEDEGRVSIGVTRDPAGGATADIEIEPHRVTAG